MAYSIISKPLTLSRFDNLFKWMNSATERMKRVHKKSIKRLQHYPLNSQRVYTVRSVWPVNRPTVKLTALCSANKGRNLLPAFKI